jgi:hypothetical protein
MEWDDQKLKVNISRADNDDLLDRITAFRVGMEADAIDLIEQELHRRGVTTAQIAEHREACERECVFDIDGSAKMCSFCRKPAVREGWGWFKLFWLVPLIPRRVRYCKKH